MNFQNIMNWYHQTKTQNKIYMRCDSYYHDIIFDIWQAQETSEFFSSDHTNNWAVLVDTSRFWFNYRHVANVLSIYRSVKRLGIPDRYVSFCVTILVIIVCFLKVWILLLHLLCDFFLSCNPSKTECQNVCRNCNKYK